MSKLSTLLEKLRTGNGVTIETTTNQYGEPVVIEELFFDDGRWLLQQLNCWSSRDIGMGSCRCVSHPIFRVSRVSRKDAMERLRAIVRAEIADDTERNLEIGWLDQSILELLAEPSS